MSELSFAGSQGLDIKTQPHQAEWRLKMKTKQTSPDSQEKRNSAFKAKCRLLGRHQSARPHKKFKKKNLLPFATTNANQTFKNTERLI